MKLQDALHHSRQSLAVELDLVQCLSMSFLLLPCGELLEALASRPLKSKPLGRVTCSPSQSFVRCFRLDALTVTGADGSTYLRSITSPLVSLCLPSDTNLGTLAKMHGYACQDLGKILPRSYQGYHDHARSWQG